MTIETRRQVIRSKEVPRSARLCSTPLFRILLWMVTMITTTSAVLFLFVWTLVYCETEIIRVEGENHIICSVDNIESPIYVNPPVTEDAKDTSILLQEDLLWNDWILEESIQSAQGPVIDKRWEDFGTTRSHYELFYTNQSISFSIFDPKVVTFFIDDDENIDYFVDTKEDTQELWIHYTVSLKDGNIFVLKNNKLIRQISNFMANRTVIETGDLLSWKIHKYQLRSSTSSSQGETNLSKLLSSNDSCLMLYASLCPYCSLEVYKSGELVHVLSGTSHPFLDTVWVSQKIQKGPQEEVALLRTNNNGTEGYWGIDVRKCPVDKSNRAILEFTLQEKDLKHNRTCKVLNEATKSQTKKPKRHVKEDKIFNCETPGELGSDCTLHCEDLLGSENKYCQKHKICEDGLDKAKCECAWGFQKSLCNEECPTGKWGLSCKEECKHDCQRCDKITGKCNKQIAEKFVACAGSKCEKECEDDCQNCNKNTGECKKSNPEIESKTMLAKDWIVTISICGVLFVGAAIAAVLTIHLHRKKGNTSDVEGEQNILEDSNKNAFTK